MNKKLFAKVVKLLLASSIFMFTALFLTGCWDRVEINDIGIILGAGLDKADNGMIELSVQLAIPKGMGGGQGGGSGGGEKPFTVEKVTGSTIFEAMANLQRSFSRRIFWGHNRVIVIGEKLAKEGIQQHMDFFARHPDPRLRSYIFVSDKASDILKVMPDLDSTSAEVTRELAKFQIGMEVTIKDFLQMLSGETGAAALPWIKVEKELKGKGGIQLNGTAIFKKDKMVGQIDEKVTRGLLWLRDEIQLATVTIEPKDSEGEISFNLLRSNTQLIPKIQKGKWKMTVKIITEDDAVENETKLNLMNPKIVNTLQKQLEEAVNQRVKLTLEKVQKEMGADVFGFGEAFHRKYPDQWGKVKGQWTEKFPDIEVEINTKAYIRRPGMSTSPQGLPEKEVHGE